MAGCGEEEGTKGPRPDAGDTGGGAGGNHTAGASAAGAPAAGAGGGSGTAEVLGAGTTNEGGSTAGSSGSPAADSGAGGAAGAESEPVCLLTGEADYAEELGCKADFLALASEPLSTTIPGARSVKTVIDRLDGNALYFQNSEKYQVHHEFAAAHLSGNGLPVVPMLGAFNQTEYTSPDRRFVLGALTYYEGPKLWVYEVAPYDTADATLIELAFGLVREATFCGPNLRFHPTSDNVAREALALPEDIPIVSTDELFAGIDYQPLNLARALGQLRFHEASELATDPVGFREIAVLDAVPNDISVCSGTITEAFQTPLSHINVLAQNRGTPNMGLRGAFEDEALRNLEGEWVALEVTASEWSIEKVTREEADEWWEEHRPAAITVPELDLETRDILPIEDLVDLESLDLAEALGDAIPAYGGKASHFSALTHIDSVELNYPPALVVPVYYYQQFMEHNGFDEQVAELLEDPAFKDDPTIRAEGLEALQAAMMEGEVDPDFAGTLEELIEDTFQEARIKVRSSTNCEDLEGFNGAGLYTSAAAALNDPERPLLDAVRTVWASVWRYRAYEEREYRGISHLDVGMALLINQAFPDELANGVAITANPFDPEGLEPGFYINVQKGDESVVLPPAGVTSDQFIVHYQMEGQPIVYLAHSSRVLANETVLTRSQINELGSALTAIHAFFDPVYGPNVPGHFYGMDVEFKFDEDEDGAVLLYIKQARPYPGRGG